MGVNASDGPAVRVTNSDGEINGVRFDTPIPDQDWSFDAITIPSIKFEGTHKSLRLSQIDLMNAHSRGGANSSGVLLDASGAVESVFTYNPDRTISGLIVMPGRTFFRPFELASTDKFDPSNNHYLSYATDPAQDPTGGPSLLFRGLGRSIVSRGLAVTCDATAGGSDTTGIPAYYLVQFIRASGVDIRVQMARADYPNQQNKKPDQVAASIAGVLQQQIIGAENRKAMAMVVASGYSLVVLDGDQGTQNQDLPTPVYLSGTWGKASIVPPNDISKAVVRIGTLIQIVANGGLGDNHPSADLLIGLVRLELPAFGSAAATATPIVT
jgi:hypothetical protein